MANTLPADLVAFNGQGQATNWSDPANWVGGTVPTDVSSVALIPVSATLNASFTTGSVMLLGNETVTVNGTLTTLSPGFCTSFMVCNGAVATFSPTSTLNDAGGLIVGNINAGVMTAQGSGSQHAMLASQNGRIGVHAGSSGTVTIDNAEWTDRGEMFVGLAGQGSLTVTDGSQITVGVGLYIGSQVGSAGHLALSDNAQITVADNARVGGGSDGDADGTGTMSVASGSTFSVSEALWVTQTGAVTLSGGTINVTNSNMGLEVASGARVSGSGTVNVTVPAGQSVSIIDNGTIEASGGTLALNGWVTGNGALKIDGGATLALNSAHVGLPTIGFVGADASLVLAHGLSEHAPITGFAAGDSIVESGVDHMSFNASTDVMTLSSGATPVDTLQFAGTYASNAFTLTQTSAGAMITLGTAHTGH